MQVKILYEDEQIIVIFKPAGMASQPDRSLQMDACSWLKNYLQAGGKANADPYIGVVHRLDRPVAGVMVYARTRGAAAELSRQVREGEMDKIYLTVLTGIPGGADPGKWVRLEARLEEGRGGRPSFLVTAPAGGKSACLEYRLLEMSSPGADQVLSLTAVRLFTGRHHQIRLQMAGSGAGIYGDTKYNPLFRNSRGWHDLALCACSLALRHPQTGKKLRFTADPGRAINVHFPDSGVRLAELLQSS